MTRRCPFCPECPRILTCSFTPSAPVLKTPKRSHPQPLHSLGHRRVLLQPSFRRPHSTVPPHPHYPVVCQVRSSVHCLQAQPACRAWLPPATGGCRCARGVSRPQPTAMLQLFVTVLHTPSLPPTHFGGDAVYWSTHKTCRQRGTPPAAAHVAFLFSSASDCAESPMPDHPPHGEEPQSSVK